MMQGIKALYGEGLTLDYEHSKFYLDLKNMFLDPSLSIWLLLIKKI